MDNSLKPFQSKPKTKKPPIKRGDGFFESIGEIGRSLTSSLKTDVAQGVAKNIHDQILNVKTQPQAPLETPDFDFSQWLNLQEENKQQEKIAKENFNKGRRYERQLHRSEQVVFSAHEKQLQQEIAEVRQELQLLIQTIGKVEQQIETAVVQEVVDPGVYHLNFFQKLATWLRMVRKSLQEGELWLEMWHSRSQRSAYWKGVKKSGSSFMLSGERSLATQTG